MEDTEQTIEVYVAGARFFAPADQLPDITSQLRAITTQNDGVLAFADTQGAHVSAFLTCDTPVAIRH
jgi:hypothetical protein